METINTPATPNTTGEQGTSAAPHFQSELPFASFL